MNINLNTCKAGDILISSREAILEYVAPTPFDGFVYKFNRMPEFDHDIVEIRHIMPKGTELKTRNEDYYSDSVIASYDIKLDGYHMVGKNASGIPMNFFLEREHVKDYFFEN